jgi:predicted metal-dependent hydrolase
VSYREQFELGVAEFNSGDFFACHDTFEDLWMEQRGERRLFLQGLIQSAVGLFHCMSGNARGAYSQLSKAIEKLEGYRPAFEGVSVDSFVDALARLREEVAAGLAEDSFQFDPGLVPSIEYRPDTSISPD